MKPLISLIVPVYNMERYLARCLDSLAAQDYSHLEIVCVDDGSTDGSGEILRSYAHKDARIKIISQVNQGLSAARNAGMAAALGEWVGFVDSDDYIAPGCMSEIAARIPGGVDLICWGATAVKQDEAEDVFWLELQNRHLRIRFEGEKRFDQRTAFKTPVTVWNKLFRRSILEQHQILFPCGALFEDNAFYWKYFPYCKRAYFIKKPFYFYTQRANSIMGKLFSNRLPSDGNGCRAGCDIIRFYKLKGLFAKRQGLLQKIFFGLFLLDFEHTSREERQKVLKVASDALREAGFSRLSPASKAVLSEDEERVRRVKRVGFLEKIFSVNRGADGGKYVYLLGVKITLRSGSKNKEAV